MGQVTANKQLKSQTPSFYKGGKRKPGKLSHVVSDKRVDMNPKPANFYGSGGGSNSGNHS